MSNISPRSLARALRRHFPFQRRVFGALRSLGLPENVYRHLPVHGWIRIPTRSGAFEMFSYGDVLENSLFWGRSGHGADAISLQAWERLAAVADGAILDIGANTGVYALIARTVNRSVTVMAFEPVRRITKKLMRNVARNHYAIDVVTKAVSDRDGVATFHDSASPDATTNAYSASLEETFGFNDHAYDVEVARLDSILPPDAKVSLIKLDVEMHEVSALRGMITIVERDRPSLLVEVLNDEIASGLQDMLLPLGYAFFSIEEEKGMHASDRLRPLGGRNFNNLVCLPSVIDSAKLSDLIVAN